MERSLVGSQVFGILELVLSCLKFSYHLFPEDHHIRSIQHQDLCLYVQFLFLCTGCLKNCMYPTADMLEFPYLQWHLQAWGLGCSLQTLSLPKYPITASLHVKQEFYRVWYPIIFQMETQIQGYLYSEFLVNIQGFYIPLSIYPFPRECNKRL